MNIKKKFQALKVLVLSAALMACSFTANFIPTATPTVLPKTNIPKTNTPEATPTIKVTPTPYYNVEPSATIRIKSGGFNFSGMRGYSVVREDNLGVYLVNQDKKVEVGLFAYPRPSGAAITGLMSDWRERFKRDFDNLAFADSVKETMNSVSAISADFTGMNKEESVQGRLTIFEPPNGKIIYMYTIALGDQRWQREGQQVFEATTASLHFFEIAALENCSIAKSPDYGFLKTKPIKIGGGKEEGGLRIDNYLGALLGPRGKIITYNTYDSITVNSVDLDVYSLRIDDNYKTLYFDRNNFEELYVPRGLSCSAPLPGKPGSGFGSNG